jgi:cobalt-zinc-cadmium efflux system protein
MFCQTVSPRTEVGNGPGGRLNGGSIMDRTRKLAISLSLNLALVAVEVSFAVVAHSTALAADAGHNLADVGALGISLVAVRLALRPPSPSRSFGNHRATILAALTNACLVAVVTLLIVVASAERLAHPVPVRAGIMVSVAALGLVVNGLCAILLRDRSGDLNMRASVVHMAGDALSSLAVVIAGAILLVAPSATWLDPAAALVITAVILVQAIRVVRGSVAVLLESTPPDLDPAAVASAMAEVTGVSQVHDLHAWSLSSDVRVLSAHVVVAGHPSLEEAQATGERVKQAVARRFAIAHATLELECERCDESEDEHCRMTPAPAVASGPGVGHRDHGHGF